MPVDYSIIVPAYNEEALLGETLGLLKVAMAAQPLTGELIVADNNSTDRTGEIARRLGARVVFEPINQISRARNAGARVAQGRYLVFVDADTKIAPELLDQALDNLDADRCCGGGAVVVLDAGMHYGGRLVLRFWNWISVRLGLAAGCFFYCRRDDFDRCGGFSEQVYASEEIWLSRCLKRVGRKDGRRFRVIGAPGALSSGRKLHWYGYSAQLLLLLALLLFPFLVRYKRFCGFWYQRP
jgi:glycosyltransferase involved in cell wall biosynthesis